MIYNRQSRRAFLRGMGGVALAIPLLESLIPLNALAQSTSNMRFVFVGGRYGRHYQSWYPETTPLVVSPEGIHNTPLSSIQGNISRILAEDFNPIRNKITLIRGLDGMQADADGHSEGMATTGSGYGASGLVFPYSVDCVLEESKKFYATPAAVSGIRSSVGGLHYIDASFSYTSRTGSPQRIQPYKEVLDLYNNYFSPANLAGKAAVNSRQKGITNLVMEDYRNVVNSRRIASSDRHKIDNYMTLLAEAEQRLGITTGSCSGGKPDPEVKDASILHKSTIDLEVAALACGMTKIVSHMIMQNTAEIISNEGESHSSAHNGKSDSGESGRASVDQWVLNKYTMARVADFIKKLDSIQESNGTLLDNTFFYYGNIEATGRHTFTDMPVIVAGAGAKIRNGYYIDYRPRPLVGDADIPWGRPINSLLVTILQSFGLTPAEYEKFGRKGFGVNDQYAANRGPHYAPFLGARVNDPLPFLYKG